MAQTTTWEASLSELKALLERQSGKPDQKSIRSTYARLKKRFPAQLEQHLSQNRELQDQLNASLAGGPGYVTVLNPTHYQALREALAQNRFHSLEGSPWPTAQLGKEGQAELIPASLEPQGHLAPEEMGAWSHLMWTQREQLSDLTVDVLDTLGAIWLRSAQSPNDDAIADLDSLLAIRGLKQRTGRTGEARGYRDSQRMEIFQSLVQIQNLWLTIGQIESYETTPKGQRKRKVKTIQSRAFIITDRLGQLRLDGCIDIEKFVFRPGKVFGQFLFGPGRQTALLSARALSYDPYREAWEKRLARYLSWHWKAHRVQDHHRYPATTLLQAIDPNLGSRYSQRNRERLEKALDKLQADQVIGDWSYSDAQGREILVSPPFATPNALTIQGVAELTLPKEEPQRPWSRLRDKRRALGLTQAALAQQLEITQAYLSMLETGKTSRQLNPELADRIYKWLNQP